MSSPSMIGVIELHFVVTKFYQLPEVSIHPLLSLEILVGRNTNIWVNYSCCEIIKRAFLFTAMGAVIGLEIACAPMPSAKAWQSMCAY